MEVRVSLLFGLKLHADTELGIVLRPKLCREETSHQTLLIVYWQLVAIERP